MKIFYLHGLEAKPSAEKMALIQAKGHEVLAPHTPYKDYEEVAVLFEVLRGQASEFGAEYLIGSSFGGFIGYWLGQALGLPQLLFNPALSYNSLLMPTPLVPVRDDLPSWVALGAQDQTVPAELNVDFFANKPQARVIVCQWLGHRIDVKTFEEMLRWAGL